MLRSYVKGAVSYVLPQARNSHSNLFPVSAEFSYSQFLRHFVIRTEFAQPRFGENVAELGPGSSLGFGLAALISGAAHYQTYDIAAHFDVTTNLRVFDKLLELFRRRLPIPHEGEFVRLFPFVDDHSFPAILSDDWMEQALAPDRLARIRREIEAGGGDTIRINIGTAGGPIDRPVDWLASHSVLEHVDRLDDLYGFLGKVLSLQGVMTHLLDFSCHGLTDSWNGHWAIGRAKWTLLRGRRTYLINREPLATHVALLDRHGMRVVETRRHRRVDGILNSSFSLDFRDMSSIDASTHMAFLICCRDEKALSSALLARQGEMLQQTELSAKIPA